MATYTLTSGYDNITGTSSDDTFNTTIATLQWADPTHHDTINGLGGTDTINFTNSGAITATQFYGVTSIEVIQLASAGFDTISVSTYMVNQSGTHTLTIHGGNAGNSFDATGMGVPVAGGQLVLDGGTSNNTYKLTVADLPYVTVNGAGSSNYVMLVGGGTANFATSGNLSGVQTIALDGSAYFLTLANSQNGIQVNMGGNANTVVVGPDTGAATFVLQAAGQTADGGSGNDVFKITAAIDTVPAEHVMTTIDGEGGGGNILAFSGGGTLDMGNLDISSVQRIQIDSVASTIEDLCGNAGNYTVAAGNGTDIFRLDDFGSATRLIAGNGNDTVWMGADTQIVSLGSGTNNVYVDHISLDSHSVINGGSGASNILWVENSGGDVAFMGRNVVGFHTVVLDFEDDGIFKSNTTAGLAVKGSELGGDCVTLNATSQSYYGLAAPDSQNEAGETSTDSETPSYNHVILNAGGLIAAPGGTTLDGGSAILCNVLEIYNGGVYNFTAAGITVKDFMTVSIDHNGLNPNTALTLNNLGTAIQGDTGNSGYNVDVNAGYLTAFTDNLTGSAGDDTFILGNVYCLANPVVVTGSINGAGGFNEIEVSRGIWNLTGTVLSNIAEIDINSGGATLVVTSAQITALLAQPGGLTLEDGPSAYLVIDVAPGQPDFNLADMHIAPGFGGQIEIVANNGGDTIWAGGGNEIIFGGTGGPNDNDWINAGSGSDLIVVGTGQNTVVYSGNGNDIVQFGHYGSTATADVVVGAATGSTTIEIVSGTVANATDYINGNTPIADTVYSPDIVNFTAADLFFQAPGYIQIDGNAIAIFSDTETQAFYSAGVTVTDTLGGVLQIIASGTSEALTLNTDAFTSATTLAYSDGFSGSIVLVDDVPVPASSTDYITVNTDVADSVTVYVGNFTNASSGVVLTDNFALECGGSFYGTAAGNFTPLAGSVNVALNGAGSQAAWVGSGVETVTGNGAGSTDFFVFDVSSANASASPAVHAGANESSFLSSASTYFFTVDALIGNSGAPYLEPNQIDVLANTDFTGAIADHVTGIGTTESPYVDNYYAAIAGVRQVYIADAVDATFTNWQLDNTNATLYTPGTTASASTVISNLDGGAISGPVVVYGQNGPSTQTPGPVVVAHSYLTIDVTTPDVGDPAALNLVNIYVVPGYNGEVDVTINDTYSGANTIQVVNGAVGGVDTAEVDPLIANALHPDQTFLFDNADSGNSPFIPTDSFNGNVFTTIDVENYIYVNSLTYDKASVPNGIYDGADTFSAPTFGSSLPGEANFTLGSVTNVGYFVIGAQTDTVAGAASVGSTTGSTAGLAVDDMGPAAAEFTSPQVDNGSAFVGYESVLMVDVNELAGLNSQSGLVQEAFVLGSNGAIHISVNTDMALFFTDIGAAQIGSYGGGVGEYLPFGTAVAFVKGDPNYVEHGAIGSFIVGGATYGVGNEGLLGSSGEDNIYAGTGTDNNSGTTAAGLNTVLDGEGGNGASGVNGILFGFNGANETQVSADLLQGAQTGWATFLFDTTDITNPLLSGPNPEALKGGAAGFAVTQDTINGFPNAFTVPGAYGPAVSTVYNQIDVAANTDFTGAVINLEGAAGMSTSSDSYYSYNSLTPIVNGIPSDPAIIFIESCTAAVFTDTQLTQFASDTVIIQDAASANLVIDVVESGTAAVDLYARFAAVLPATSFDLATGVPTQWDVTTDTLTMVANASGSHLVASDLPGVDSGTLYLDGQGGNDTFLFSFANLATNTPLLPLTVGQDPNALIATLNFGGANAHISGGGGTDTIVVDMTTPSSSVSAYDFTGAAISSIEAIQFTHSGTMAVFSEINGPQLSWTGSGPSIALVNNYGGSDYNLVEDNGNGNLDLSHLDVSQWGGSQFANQSEIIIDDVAATTSVNVVGSHASDEIIVNGYGDAVRGDQGPDLVWFQSHNAANNYDYVFSATPSLSDVSTVNGGTGGGSANELGAVADLIEGYNGYNGPGIGYTGALNTISSTAVDPNGYLDIALNGFTGLSSTVYTTPLSGSQNVGASGLNLGSYGVIEDTDTIGLSFTAGGSGLGKLVNRPGVQAAVNDVASHLTADHGQEFVLVMYDSSHLNAAVFLVDKASPGNGLIGISDIQVLGVIDHAVASGSLLPAHFFHMHA